MFYVYMYVRPDGTPWYVGKGCKYRRRHYQSDTVARCIARPDDDSLCVMVQENMTEAAAFALEVELIAKYKRECDGGILVNKCLGGPGTKGFKHKPGRPSPMKGKKHSDVSKAKMSDAKQGNQCRAGTVTYVITDKEGNHTVVTNLAAYCRKHDLNRKALTNVLCGRSKSHKGLTIQRMNND
jgi:hypothetical protein